MAAVPEPTPADGRTARRQQNIDAVVDAVLGLIREGEAFPTAPAIAERAGVGVRSLFRYAPDVAGLTLLAVERQMASADHLFEPLPGGGDLPTRVERLIAHRLHQHDEVGAVVRAARLRAATVAAVAAGLEKRHGQLRAQLQSLFAAELKGLGRAAADTLTALELLTGFEAVEALRVERGLSPARARSVLRRGLLSLLDPQGAHR